MIAYLQATATTAADPAHAAPGAVVVTTDPAHGAATTTHVVPAGDATHATTEVAHEAPSSGMPQLDTTTFANQIFWLLIAIGLVYWILSRIALPRLAGVLADRQGAITGDLGAAEEFKRRARDAEAAYDRALAQARGEAQGIVKENRAVMQGELNTAIAHADAEIAARGAESEARIGAIRDRADTDARSVAREVTAELLSAFGGRADPGAIDAAVDQRLGGTAR